MYSRTSFPAHTAPWAAACAHVGRPPRVSARATELRHRVRCAGAPGHAQGELEFLIIGPARALRARATRGHAVSPRRSARRPEVLAAVAPGRTASATSRLRSGVATSRRSSLPSILCGNDDCAQPSIRFNLSDLSRPQDGIELGESFQELCRSSSDSKALPIAGVPTLPMVRRASPWGGGG